MKKIIAVIVMCFVLLCMPIQAVTTNTTTQTFGQNVRIEVQRERIINRIRKENAETKIPVILARTSTVNSYDDPFANLETYFVTLRVAEWHLAWLNRQAAFGPLTPTQQSLRAALALSVRLFWGNQECTINMELYPGKHLSNTTCLPE